MAAFKIPKIFLAITRLSFKNIEESIGINRGISNIFLIQCGI